MEGRGGGLVTAGIQRAIQSCSMKKNNKWTCSLGAEKIGMAGNTGCFVFLLSPPHSLAATKHVEPQHLRSHRQSPNTGILLAKLSGVALRNPGKNYIADNFCPSLL